MSNLVPFNYSFQSNSLPVPSDLQLLPPGQSQLVHITCTPESVEFLLETFRAWFADERWSHVIIMAHSAETGAETGKQGNAFFVLEWEGAYIDAFFLRVLETEDSVIDFTAFIRNSEV